MWASFTTESNLWSSAHCRLRCASHGSVVSLTNWLKLLVCISSHVDSRTKYLWGFNSWNDSYYIHCCWLMKWLQKYAPGCWPDKEKLGLNESQMEAFKSALCQEFAIIQGIVKCTSFDAVTWQILLFSPSVYLRLDVGLPSKFPQIGWRHWGGLSYVLPCWLRIGWQSLIG